MLEDVDAVFIPASLVMTVFDGVDTGVKSHAPGAMAAHPHSSSKTWRH